MQRMILSFLLAAAFVAAPSARGEQPVAMTIRAPDFDGVDEWINSDALHFKDLKGKVVVLHFWTFG